MTEGFIKNSQKLSKPPLVARGGGPLAVVGINQYTYSDTETTATNRISRVKNTLNGAVKSDYGYTYDNRGNILTVSKSGVLFQQYVLLTLAAIAMILRNMEKASPF